MKSIQLSKLFLAVLVICSFSFVGVAIAYRNIWLTILGFIVGFLIMGYGISLKRKNTIEK
ncbi:hypothetical protein GH741_04320 [Aquibacillus halophilus]|uniref:Uncharacterized protein n=1 Tax=Aquibacillus halophilus TaxID=930132 RepID=A0A6A8D8I3_9BACI|nr:DUF5325 family protein [Aquibacillus halophilus]MRH41898.1 hypothetical protein [Aquibacillus halophilus]